MERVSRKDLLSEAKAIAATYGGNLTLRQLYYQCVAQGHSPNSQQDYNRLKDIISDARMSGAFPFSWIIDRSRTVHGGQYRGYWADVEEALEDAANDIRNLPSAHLQASRWWGQSRHVSVWVEKEALSGVFERPCKSLGVSWFACKGYPSLSSLWAWVQEVSNVYRTARDSDAWEGGLDEAVILYFGDHDPDGFQIHKTALATSVKIARLEGFAVPDIRLERVALNRDQIDLYNPPPFPAKKSSPRYKRYAAEHPWTRVGPGHYRSWELDALQPPQLEKLIKDSVKGLFDLGRYSKVQGLIQARRDEMRTKMKTGDWLATALQEIS